MVAKSRKKQKNRRKTTTTYSYKRKSISQDIDAFLDGDYSRTYEIRIAACDIVIFLDYGEDVCMRGITERVGKVR